RAEARSLSNMRARPHLERLLERRRLRSLRSRERERECERDRLEKRTKAKPRLSRVKRSRGMYTSPTSPYFSKERRSISGDVRYVRLST
uniref:Uncharacterized protein n=1 Tax=Petromyzon marinus TaxID=7757 RepID=S4RLS5_PETMA